jgi:aryl-alcohol dehydrogenase-like predicted oxidoreductase
MTGHDMRYGTIPGIEKPVARLVQGTILLTTRRLRQAFALLDAVYALGGNAFDTAHVYGEGESERVLGRWMRSRGLREQVVIVSKGAHANADRRRLTPADITSDLQDSLVRLQTDVIDLYLLHHDDPAMPVGPVVETLDAHRRAGRIGAWGVSNWSHARVQEANAYAAAHGLTPVAASSPHFSLAAQVQPPWPGCLSIAGTGGRAARAWYAQARLPVLAWSSLAGGFFSGRFRRDNVGGFTRYFEQLCVATYASEENFRRLDRAEALAKKKGATLPQIALAYVLGQPLDAFALVGCQSGEEFADARRAVELTLTPDELATLDSGD